MLVSPKRNCGVGGLSQRQRQDQTQMVLRRSGFGLKGSASPPNVTSNGVAVLIASLPRFHIFKYR